MKNVKERVLFKNNKERKRTSKEREYSDTLKTIQVLHHAPTNDSTIQQFKYYIMNRPTIQQFNNSSTISWADQQFNNSSTISWTDQQFNNSTIQVLYHEPTNNSTIQVLYHEPTNNSTIQQFKYYIMSWPWSDQPDIQYKISCVKRKTSCRDQKQVADL